MLMIHVLLPLKTLFHKVTERLESCDCFFPCWSIHFVLPRFRLRLFKASDEVGRCSMWYNVIYNNFLKNARTFCEVVHFYIFASMQCFLMKIEVNCCFYYVYQAICSMKYIQYPPLLIFSFCAPCLSCFIPCWSVFPFVLGLCSSFLFLFFFKKERRSKGEKEERRKGLRRSRKKKKELQENAKWKRGIHCIYFIDCIGL